MPDGALTSFYRLGYVTLIVTLRVRHC